MLVEGAIERFLTTAPSVEALPCERLDDMHARFDRLEHDIRLVAEAVALHARYQLAVTPPVHRERQREAILLGDGRFKVLAEQVDRRVRQETIDALHSQSQVPAQHETGEVVAEIGEVATWAHGQKANPECSDVAGGLNPGEGGAVRIVTAIIAPAR